MRRILMLAGCLAVLASPALAGRNANGALVVHTTPENIYRYPNFCETATPTVCEELNPTSQDDVFTPTVIWFLAAFQAQASPGVTAIQFGIRHSLPAGQGYFEYWRDCGPVPSEVPDAGWPEVSDTGNILSFAYPMYDTVFKFYFFAVWHDSEQDFVSIRTYPATDEAKFFDTTNPPVEDLIFNFGTVRWEVPGRNDCPTGGDYCTCCLPDGVCLGHLPTDDCYAQGGECLDPNVVCDPNPCAQPEACCFDDFSCRVLLAEECIGEGGTPQGPGTSCDPNLCEMEHFPEACCFDDGHCEFLGNDTCAELGGAPQGLGTTCETVICETVPIENTTWGSIKARFR